MKIYIVTDMEGVCGIVNFEDWVLPESRYYEEGKRLLSLETSAAAEGFFESGATDVYVVDGHGMGGIDQRFLDSRTCLIRGSHGPYPFSLDGSFSAMAWVGQHAKAGTGYAHMAHTGWFNVLDYRINGASVGEFGQMAWCGAFLGVPSIFGSGDEAFTREAQELIPGIETVSVKRGLVPGSGDEYAAEGYRKRNLAAIHLHPEKVRSLIRAGAARALARFKSNPEGFHRLPVKPPFRRNVSYRAEGGKPAYKAWAEDPSDLIRMLNAPETKAETGA
jgi:D-amino peptidase